MQNENRLTGLCDFIKWNNICIIVIPEEEKRAENFPNPEKETETQIQEAQRSSSKINPRRSIPGPIVINLGESSDN